MIDNLVTKEDLHNFRLLLLADIENLILKKDNNIIETEWLRSKDIRKILNVSPGTLQNMRIAGKLKYRKILGSYYYNKNDLENLFK